MVHKGFFGVFFVRGHYMSLSESLEVEQTLQQSTDALTKHFFMNTFNSPIAETDRGVWAI